MDGKIIAVVQDAVEKLSDELISLTQDLVRIPQYRGTGRPGAGVHGLSDAGRGPGRGEL